MGVPDYKAMYFALFNAVTDALEGLKAAQVQGEDTYSMANQAEPPLPVLLKTREISPSAAENKKIR